VLLVSTSCGCENAATNERETTAPATTTTSVPVKKAAHDGSSKHANSTARPDNEQSAEDEHPAHNPPEYIDRMLEKTFVTPLCIRLKS